MLHLQEFLVHHAMGAPACEDGVKLSVTAQMNINQLKR
jgi:hypothetical protein